jgi:hypothetical protein
MMAATPIFLMFFLMLVAVVGALLLWLPRPLVHKVLRVAALIGIGLLFALLFGALIDSHLPPVMRVLAFFGVLALTVLFVLMLLRLFDPAMGDARPAASLSPAWLNDMPARRLPSGEFAQATAPLAARISRLSIPAVLLASLPLAILAFLVAIVVWPPHRPDELFAAVLTVLFFWVILFALPSSLIIGLCRKVSRNDCPPVSRLKDLLAERLRSEERARLTAHLEICSACQHRLEGLTAGQKSWAGLASKLSERPPSPEPALQKVMARLKEDKQEVTHDEPAFAGDLPLGFLSPTDKPGQLGRLERYEVLEEIGRGGMGVVLKAFDPSLHRVVAIKVLAPQLATSGVARKRFLREAKAAAAVTHDHIVTIHAVDEANGLPYLVMQYIAGQSLQDRLDKEGPLELAEILRIGMQTASGLAAAHGHGIVHRDIKPANILLEDGVQRVKITDFGLARAMDDASLTQSGFVAGSPLYMAPEQARGEALDHRADLFSLGSVLYTMCTGRPPFRAANTLAVLRRVSEDAPRPIRETNPEIPDWLSEVVDKLLAKEPGERYQSAGEVVEVLGQQLAKLQHGAWVPPAASNAPPAGLPTSVTICPSCGASLHVPESMVGTLVHCAECGKPFQVEEGSEVIQVARPVPSPFGPRARVRKRIPAWVWIVGGCAVLFGCFLLCAGLYSSRQSKMPAMIPPKPPTPPQATTAPAREPFWKDTLSWFPPEASLFGVLDLKTFSAHTLEDEWTQTLLRLVAPEATAEKLTPENLGRLRLDRVSLAYYEETRPEKSRAIVQLEGLALDGRKRIIDYLRRMTADKVEVVKDPRTVTTTSAIRVSGADLPFALGLFDDHRAFLAMSGDRKPGEAQHRKALEELSTFNFPSTPQREGNLVSGYKPPWVQTALAEIPWDASGFFLGEIPSEFRKVLTDTLKLRVCPRTFVLHIKREGEGFTLSLSLNVDKAGAELLLLQDLEKWRTQAVDVLQTKFPSVKKEPEALALVGQTLKTARWGANPGGKCVSTYVQMSGPTWKAVRTLLKRVGRGD